MENIEGITLEEARKATEDFVKESGTLIKDGKAEKEVIIIQLEGWEAILFRILRRLMKEHTKEMTKDFVKKGMEKCFPKIEAILQITASAIDMDIEAESKKLLDEMFRKKKE